MHDAAMLFDGFSDESAALQAVPKQSDPGLSHVANWFRRRDNLEQRFSAVLRQSIDEVLDGQRTGRFDIDTAEKTEKTYLGTKVEIVCRAEFGLGRGLQRMDYRVADEDVDAKFSLSGNWMIPREAMGHICLLMEASDVNATFNIGLARIRNEILTGGSNQDGKRSISKEGKNRIEWLIRNGSLVENTLLRMRSDLRESILSGGTGQKRVNALFMEMQGVLIDRNTVVTVAKQLDSAKRVRDARNQLASRGVVILGHQKSSPRIAQGLGLPVPAKGYWVSARLVSDPGTGNRDKVRLAGCDYVVAQDGEPEEQAPKIDC